MHPILFPVGSSVRKLRNNIMLQKLLRGLPLVLRLPVVRQKAPKKTAQGAKTLLERLKEFAVRHTHAMIIILVFALLFLMISGAFSSCSAVVQGGTSSLLGTSFTATDEDITGTNEDYKALEAALKK